MVCLFQEAEIAMTELTVNPASTTPGALYTGAEKEVVVFGFPQWVTNQEEGASITEVYILRGTSQQIFVNQQRSDK